MKFDFPELLVYLGLSLPVIWAMMKLLGNKWANEIFDKRLEKFKTEQNKVLDEFRFNVAILQTRLLKVYEKEFEILPEAWARLVKAKGIISKMVSPIKEVPNLNSLKENELEDFIDKIGFANCHKDELRSATDKEEYYYKCSFWYELKNATTTYHDFHNFINLNKIFLSKELGKKFNEIDMLLWTALKNSEISEQMNDLNTIISAYKDLQSQCDQLLTYIESMIQERIHFYEHEIAQNPFPKDHTHNSK
jgi:hypothetical protein